MNINTLTTIQRTTTQFWRSIPWPRIRKLLRLWIVGLFIIIVFRTSTPPPGDLTTGAAAHAKDSLFDYVGWEVEAVLNKAFQSVFGVQGYLDETARADYVRSYMADLGNLLRLEREITDIYTDPEVSDPDAASADLRAERDTLRTDLTSRQNMAESIIEEQVSTVLVDEGLAFLGQVLPPVAIRFTPLPDVLIIAPRDEIRVETSLSLDALSTDRRNALESAVDVDLDVASLVVDIGGMALYPSMVAETDWLDWNIETAAHEWVHHYLFFYPLGLNYLNNEHPETRIINETTADILGKEIGREVLRRYYPELAPPEPEPQPAAPPDDVDAPAPSPTPDPEAFNFAATMHETRVTVDELLAEGEIEAAENYMEERRALFHANGHPIRKINQAYFAFYGGYQGEDNQGTAGEDPIGPTIKTIREETGNVADFLAVMRGITTREQLFTTLDNLPD